MRYLALIIAFMLPFRLLAEQASIQTGEHADFTRVVVSIPAGAEWRLGRNAEGYLLRVTGVTSYDLTGFFNLIPRARIRDANVGAAPDLLQLVVDCLCYADAFLDRPDILVIDLISGAAPNNAAFEQPFVQAPEPVSAIPALQRYRVAENRLLPFVTTRNPAADAPPSQDTTSVEPARAAEARDNRRIFADEIDENRSNPGDAKRADLDALAQSITESLARGLSQGVLRPDLDPQRAQPPGIAFQDIIPPGIETRSGIDPSAIPPNPRIARTQEGQVCPPDVFFDIAAWGDTSPFSEQLGRLRSDFIGEFDRLDEASLLAKARLFVHFGFGREAIQTLALDGALSLERRYLIGLAQIIDEDPLTPGLFDRLVSCPAPVALWALLAAGDGGLDGVVDAPSVLRAFKALPLHLQSHLGPRLSERFLAIGDEDSALQSLAKAVAEPEPRVDAQLAEAALLADIGETEQANANLTALARAENRTTPAAMAAFLRAATADDVVVTDQDFALADVLRFENAASADLKELQIAQMDAYLHQNAFDTAADLLEDLRMTAEAAVVQRVENALAQTLTERADDLRFLDFAFDYSVEGFDAPLGLAVADRLLALGFPDRANEVLANAPADENEPERAHLRAEAALMRGDVPGALAALDGVETERAIALRDASGRVARGELFDRGRLETGPDGSDLWRNSDWAEMSRSDDPLLRDVAAVVRARPAASLTAESPIADGRGLIEQSTYSRNVVDRLLERFSTPSDS